MWPTPTCSDASGGFCPPEKAPDCREGSAGPKEITPGLLNPRWVETLMGWPMGFLGLPPEVLGPLVVALRKRRGSRPEPAAEPRSAASSSEP